MEITVSPHAHPNRKWVGRLVRTVGLTGGGFLSGCLAIAYYIVRRITAPTPVTAFDSFTFTPFEVGVPYDSVTFPSSGDVHLPGWWMRRPESNRVIIVCIGYRGRRADLLGIAASLWRDGCNVLIFDYRGHGELAGTPVTLGYREVEDLLSAIAWVKGQIPDAAIGLLGYSMGASVAIMGAARCPDVQVVVADSPFARQRNAVSLAIRRVLKIPHDPLLHLVDFLLGHVGGYHFRDVEPLREVGLIAPRPLLLIHGEADSVTDPHDSEELYAAADEPKELWTIPGVEHCGVYFADRAYYCARVVDFFHRALCAPALAISAEAQTAR